VVDGFATATCPGGQFIVLPHVIASPPPDHSFAEHARQPEVEETAPFASALAY